MAQIKWLRKYRLRKLGGSCALVAILASAMHAQGAQWQVVAEGLDHPWAVAFPAPGQYLVTERAGRLVHVGAEGTRREVGGLPSISPGGQGGLLDLILDRDYPRNHTLYFCFTEADGAGKGTALARARWQPGQAQLSDVQVLFRQMPKLSGNLHFGCRIAERPDGTLVLALGERYSAMQQAQALDNHLGKTIRIHKDGRVPADNPFVGRPKARPEIWTLGHRNPQGLISAPDGTLWLHEHGPQGGDELNRLEAGRNYGWPVITYGENYGGGKIGEGIVAAPGMEQPIHHWVPSIAPSGLARVDSARYPNQWQGQLLIGSLKFARVHRVAPTSGGTRDEVLQAQVGARVRDVRQAPDGWIYVLTDEGRGRLLRLLP